MAIQEDDFIGAEARSADGAAAVAAAIGGMSVSKAYQRQGIALPSIGAQVDHPVAADALQAGDVGMRRGDFVMALGNDKVLVSGTVQSIDSVSTGPDFLGWFDPTKRR